MYINKTDVQNYSGIAINETLNSFIEDLINTAQDYIEEYTSRKFENTDEDTTRYYDGNGETKMKINDIREITSLTVDFNGESETALTNEDDYFLYPLNATEDEKPFTEIQLIQPETRLNLNSRLRSASPYLFDVGQRTVKVVGKFGYSVTPPSAIKTVAVKLVLAMLKENIGDADLKEITQESLGDYSASFVKVKEIAERLHFANILDKYKRNNKKVGYELYKAS